MTYAELQRLDIYKTADVVEIFDENGIEIDDNESEIDCIKHLNEGGKLRVLLNGLISALLKYHGKKLMVISIDDLDLNIRHSYVMMENIRKFLIMPEVAIIIAARYSQLFDSICLVLTQHYEKISDRVSDKDISETVLLA